MPLSFWRSQVSSAVLEQWRSQRTCLARDVTGRFANADAASAWASANGYDEDEAAAVAEAWEQALHEEDWGA